MYKKLAFLLFVGAILITPTITKAIATENLLLIKDAEKINEVKILESGPDLVITASDLSLNKTAIKPGDTVLFKAIIKNFGTDKAANFKVRFLLSEKKIYEKNIATLSKNTKTSVSYSYKIPIDFKGGQLFSVIIDPENVLPEINENNNKAEMKIEILEADKSDLVVVGDNLSMNKQSAMGGDKVNLKAIIQNSGLTQAKNVVARFFFANVQIYEKKIPTISKNSKTTINYNYELPANISGAQIFKVVIDPENKIIESDEKNNEAEKIINIDKAGRDLMIEFLKGVPANPKVGQVVTWSIKVKNVGTSKAQNVKINFYADNTSSNPTATFVVPNISANAATVKTVKWTVPSNISTAVGYTVRVIVDPDNTIDETNENNNTKTTSINLIAPDLKIEKGINGYITGPIYPNVKLMQRVKVTNNNVLPVNNVKVALFYYLGTNSTNFIKLSEQNLGTLSKKASTEAIIEGSLPSNLALGTVIHVLTKVDYDNKIVETDETNNTFEATRTMIEKPRTVTYPYLRVIVNDENGDPKNGAVVKLTNTATGAIETKTTGSEAFYNSLGNVIFESRSDIANYTVEVSSAGYRTTTETFFYDKTNDNTQERVINLDKKALVSGVVTGPNGAVMSGVKIRVEGTGLEAISDYQGKYGFLLNGGTYTFRFVKEGYARLEETNKTITPLSTVVMNKQMSVATVAYISGTATDDEGNPLQNVDVWVNGNLVRVTGVEGRFSFTSGSGSKNFKFKRPNYITVEFSQTMVAGEEYDFSFTMYKPNTDTHIERGTKFVSWHQHEGTPANSFFIPEYNVDVWWGNGSVKIGLDSKGDDPNKLTNLTVRIKGNEWECNKVEGSGDIETSAIDIPITISAGSCSNKKTQINVAKIAIISGGQEVWTNDGFWTTASDPMNVTVKSFPLNNLQVLRDSDFKIQIWLRVQKKAVIGTDGDGAGALVGYNLDKKKITFYPQKPATIKFKTSWGQIGGYFLGILDNPVNAVTSFTDLFTVEQFNQYTMENVLPQDFPGYINY